MKVGTVRRTRQWALFGVAGMLVAACASNEDGGDPTPTPTATPVAPAPPIGAALTGLSFSDGWVAAHTLPAPVNTAGWEDSSFISPDGTTLYFGYTRYDFGILSTGGGLVATGPSRPGEKGDAFDIYEARISGNAWVVENSTVNVAGPDVSEAAQGVDAAGERMVFIRFENTPQYNPNIYTADWNGAAWTNVTKLPAPVNTDCAEDNTHISADGLRLWFDSNRTDIAGTSCKPDNGLQERDIYVSTWNGTAWGDPVKAMGPEFSAVHWQPFEDPDGQHLYWSGADATCLYGCLYKSTLQSNGTWGEVTPVIRALGDTANDVRVLGEMSITADGEYLYFTYGLRNTAGVWDLSIGVASK